MISQDEITNFGNLIAEKFLPEKIILFGSHAYGNPTVDSDVDLLVVMQHVGSARDAAISLKTALPRLFPLDLIVRSPEELLLRLNRNDFFMREIMEKGKTLYERIN